MPGEVGVEVLDGQCRGRAQLGRRSGEGGVREVVEGAVAVRGERRATPEAAIPGGICVQLPAPRRRWHDSGLPQRLVGGRDRRPADVEGRSELPLRGHAHLQG